MLKKGKNCDLDLWSIYHYIHPIVYIYVCKVSWEVTYICRLHCKSCKMFTFQGVNFISDYVYYLHSRLIFAEILFRVIYFYVNLRFCLFSCGFIFGNGLQAFRVDRFSRTCCIQIYRVD